MKTRTLLFIASILFWQVSNAQVNPGQIDDFENGTTENWTDGGSSVPPVNISTGGPAGANDNYLSDPSLGGGGPGSKMVMFNDQQWAGNYSGNNIIAIRFQARALTNTLNLRIAFDGAGGRICTTNAVTIPAGSPWTNYEIPIFETDFTLVSGGANVAQTLADVTDMRILSNSNPAWQGESIVATLEIDNIEAATTLGLDEASLISSFEMIPNPSHDQLNIKLNKGLVEAQEISVFDQLGHLILQQKPNSDQFSINVTNWNSGLYFVKIADGTRTQVKKFIKL